MSRNEDRDRDRGRDSGRDQDNYKDRDKDSDRHNKYRYSWSMPISCLISDFNRIESLGRIKFQQIVSHLIEAN